MAPPDLAKGFISVKVPRQPAVHIVAAKGPPRAVVAAVIVGPKARRPRAATVPWARPVRVRARLKTTLAARVASARVHPTHNNPAAASARAGVVEVALETATVPLAPTRPKVGAVVLPLTMPVAIRRHKAPPSPVTLARPRTRTWTWAWPRTRTRSRARAGGRPWPGTRPGIGSWPWSGTRPRFGSWRRRWARSRPRARRRCWAPRVKRQRWRPGLRGWPRIWTRLRAPIVRPRMGFVPWLRR